MKPRLFIQDPNTALKFYSSQHTHTLIHTCTHNVTNSPTFINIAVLFIGIERMLFNMFICFRLFCRQLLQIIIIWTAFRHFYFSLVFPFIFGCPFIFEQNKIFRKTNKQIISICKFTNLTSIEKKKEFLLLFTVRWFFLLFLFNTSKQFIFW